MEFQAVEEAADRTARAVADEMRAEMARQRKTAVEFAAALGITPHTAGRRLNGESPFSIVELARGASWLGLTVGELISRAERAEAVAS